jgi:hypothetical protein
MAETNPHPYDLDVIDPIVVEEYRSPWSFIIPAGAGIVALWYLLEPAKIQFRLFMKGQWLGETGLAPGLLNFVIGVCLALISLLICSFCKRERLGFVSLAIYLLVFLSQVFILPHIGIFDEVHRFKNEVADYKTAVATNQAYGDQFSERSDDRQLTYWRWAQFGIDNAVGVIYDPADCYGSGDSLAFRKQTHGGISRIQKMEPHWYIVWHT